MARTNGEGEKLRGKIPIHRFLIREEIWINLEEGDGKKE